MGSRSEKIGFRVEVDFPNPLDAEAAYLALKPEVGVSRRFKALIHREGNRIILEVDAEDLSALRAALNSYLRWVAMIEKLQKPINPS